MEDDQWLLDIQRESKENFLKVALKVSVLFSVNRYKGNLHVDYFAIKYFET